MTGAEEVGRGCDGSDRQGEAAAKQRRVLVVEDNPVTRKLLRVALEVDGFGVVAVGTAAEALAVAIASPPDAIVQDLVLPDMDGARLLRALRRLPTCTDVPIIVCSGFAERMEEARLLTSGFSGFLLKPVDPLSVAHVVRAHLYEPPERAGEDRGVDVVMVDDDPAGLKLQRLHLERAGFQVRPFSDGLDAFNAIRASPPRVVVADILMPGLDGFSLCLRVREAPETADVVVVLTTATFLDEEDSELARRVGADALVLREPDAGVLIETIDANLSRPSRDRPAASEALADECRRRVIGRLRRHVVSSTELSHRAGVLAAELAVLSRMSEALVNATDADRAVEQILVQCLDAVGISFGAVLLRDERGGLRARAACGWPDDAISRVTSVLSEGERLRDLLGGAPLATVPIDELLGDREPHIPCPQPAGIVILSRLTFQGQDLGVFVVSSDARTTATGGRREFVRAITAQLAQAVALACAFHRCAASESRCRTILECAHDGIFVLDRRGDVTEANAQATSMLDRRRAEIIGHNYLEFVAPEDRQRAKLMLSGLLEGTPAPDRIHLIRENGVRVPTECSSAFARIEHESVVIAIARDLSWRINAEREIERQREVLEHTERVAAMGSLAAGVAHELNNPLAIVLGYSELLVETTEGDVGRRIREIRRAAERCARIVDSFLAMARRRPTEPTACDLNGLVDEALDLVAYPLRVANITVERELAADLPPVLADRHQIHQVIVNLVTNAQHAIAEGVGARRIVLRTRDVGHGLVEVAVEDSGPGVPDDMAQRIFEPFFTTKDLGEGTGLGLSMCRGTIESHGGTLVLDRNAGRGALFRLTLPVATGDASTTSTAQRRVADHTRPLSVLVIDDEEAVAEVVAEMLRVEGHDVTACNNARDALETIREREFDVIVSDVRMPGMDGRALFEAVRDCRPALAAHFLFLTGDSLSPATRSFLEASRVAHVPKPVRAVDLATAVRRAARSA